MIFGRFNIQFIQAVRVPANMLSRSQARSVFRALDQQHENLTANFRFKLEKAIREPPDKNGFTCDQVMAFLCLPESLLKDKPFSFNKRGAY